MYSVQGLCFVMLICRPVEQYFELCEVSIQLKVTDHLDQD
jgi:hypothetical protein